MDNEDDKYLKLLEELAEAKRTIDSLSEVNNTFNLLVNYMVDFVWKTNKEYDIIYVSPSVKRILGYTEKEFLRIKFIDLVTPESKDEIRKSFNDRLEGILDNTSKQWVTQTYHKNGIVIWIETTTNPIVNSAGEFEGILGVSRDITQRMSFERRMQESEANLQAQIENTSDIIWSIDDAYCIKTLNSNFKNGFKIAFGVDLAPGISIVNSLPEPFRTNWKERYDKALKGERFSITDHFDFEGVAQYVEVTFNPILFNEKVIGVSVFSRDITSQKISEQGLIESSANILSLIENTDARIWSFNKDLNIISINSNYQNDYKIAFGVTLEKDAYALPNLSKEIESKWIDLYERALSGEKYTITDEFDIVGVPRYINVSFNPIFIDNKVIGATCYSHDITALKMSELALKESEERFKSLVANIPSTTYRCLADKEWTMNFISHEILNLSGYPPEDFINNKIRSYTSIIYSEDIEYVELFGQEKLDQKESYSLEYRINHKNGEIRWVHEQGRGNYDEYGNLESIDGVISDITLRKKGEQELQNSELKFRILSDASIDMLSLETKNDILKYSADALYKRLNHTVILAFSISLNRQSTQLVHISGIEGKDLVTLGEMTGGDHFNTKYDLNPNIRQDISTGKVFEYTGKFSDLAFKQFNKHTADQIGKVFKINKIYAVGIIKDNDQFGALYMFPQDAFDDSDIQFIESFSILSSILLQRQQLTEALHQSEDKFRSFFENTGSIISIETENNIFLTNKAFHETFGYSDEELKELNPLDLVHPNDKERIAKQTKNRIQGEEVATTYLVHAIDKYFNEKWLDISASLIDYEGQKASLIVGSDITERKKADLQLNKFSTGIMNSPSSIVITDIDGTIEYVNPFFTEFTGYTFDEALGGNPKMLNSGKNPKEIFVDMWDTILRGEVWNGELLNKKKNGQLYWETARIAPIFDENGILTNFIAIKEDITERKRTLELMEQSEKDLRDINAKKDKFFSIIAHDLRSPFSGLAGLTEILKNSIHELSNEQIDTYLDLINQSIQNIFKLLENLLSWAKSQTGKIEFNPTQLNLTQLVNETVSVIDISAKNKNISIEVNINEDATVFGDGDMLNTVLRNLISNALKYTHKKGKIKIFSEVHKHNNKTFTIIGVKDNGIGIPKDKLSKIFNIEDNYTTNGTEKEKGTGLGLILCKEFVERHNGKIWCESEENVGSTFYFSLHLS